MASTVRGARGGRWRRGGVLDQLGRKGADDGQDGAEYEIGDDGLTV